MFPYLPLGARCVVGEWFLVPPTEICIEDARDEEAFRAAEGLAKITAIAEQRQRMGAFAISTAGRLGDTFPEERVVALHRAVAAAALDRNGTMAVPPEQQRPDEELRAVTSENLVLRGHHLKDGQITERLGYVVSKTCSTNVHLSDRSVPPRALHLPLFAPALDVEYAGDLYRLLTDGSAAAERMRRAIEWLLIAWSNSMEIPTELRIIALRTGFETLLGEDEYLAAATALSALLEPPEVPKVRREWQSAAGKLRHQDLSDLAWWFVKFSWLRNDIVHVRPFGDAWYGGREHIWLAEHRLRLAIRETVKRVSP